MTRTASRAWRVALLLGAAASPWCEAGALDHAQEKLAARVRFGDWDLDVRGLQLRDVEAELKGRGLAADAIAIGLGDDGIAIDVAGLVERPLGERAPATVADGSAAPIREGPERKVFDTHGIAVHVRSAGTLAIALPDGGSLTLADPAVDLDGRGGLELRTRAHVDAPSPLGTIAADVPELVVRREDDRWRASGTTAIDRAVAVSFAVERPDRGAMRMLVADAGGGSLELVVEGKTRARMHAERFALAGLGPTVLARLRNRGLGLEGARISGGLALVRDETIRVHADELVADGVVIDDRRLAARPVRLDAVTLDGELGFTDLARFDAKLAIAHRGAALDVVAARDGDALRVELALTQMGCTELLAALPSGMAEVLRGARLSGTIDGHAVLDVSLAELARARAQGEADPDEVRPPPGLLTLDFDVLGRCAAIAPPASIDIEGLRGPWRHRYVADDGRMHERVLASGAPGFAALARVPRIAEAFVALEDMRFWSHDGFDREQIERAFWYNLEHGRVRRGASTISQQTARNLWLGVDRSLARKLQEAWLTALLEDGLGKQRILELYLNLVELGPGVYGVDAGARHHFGVPPEQLTVLQAIHLAALAPAPRTLGERFAGGEVDDTWLAELRDHARRMHRNHMITDAELSSALHGELQLVRR